MLEVMPITRPACLGGQSNGQLTAASTLTSVPGINGTPTIRLVGPAMRAWKALSGTALQAGVVLAATSSADSYRTYAQQVATFTSRYQVEPTTNGYKLWDSDGNGVRERWYKKDNVASAAVPGTSNHGWGLAVDVANAFGSRLDWLEAHALTFGWSWELVPEEPWHIHYWTGDDIPAAVLAYEGDDDMTTYFTFNEQQKLTALFDKLAKVKLDTDSTPDGTGTLVEFPVPMVVFLDKLAADVAELKARPPVAAAPVDPAALKAVLMDPEVLGAIAAAVVDEEHNRLAQ